MTFPHEVEAVIGKALSSMNFAPDTATTLTPEQRAAKAEKAVRSLVKTLLAVGVAYTCPHCKHVERLDAAHETPVHRHGKVLYLLSKC